MFNASIRLSPPGPNSSSQRGERGGPAAECMTGSVTRNQFYFRTSRLPIAADRAIRGVVLITIERVSRIFDIGLDLFVRQVDNRNAVAMQLCQKTEQAYTSEVGSTAG